MIIESFRSRFNVLKSNNCHIQYVLDIGAYRGDFTETVRSVWPTAIIKQIEADERQQPWLEDTSIIALLGDTDGKEVNYYTLTEDKITTGSSIYKELTPHYNTNSTVVIKKTMTTIDSLNIEYNFYGNWREFGLIKIDTQGSELIILDGACDFLKSKEPKYILLECSIQEYNLGAPNFSNIIDKMISLSYTIYDIFDISYDNRGNLLQLDILFKRQ
jgi:FkbM family methyltransferase